MTRLNSLLSTAFLLMLSASIAFAQDERKSIKLGVSYFQINDQTHEVSATAKSKRGKKFEPVSNVEVEFFLGEQSPANSIGKAKTNRKGIASLELPIATVSKLDSMSR